MAKAPKTTELEQTFNGLVGYIYARDAVFFEAISEKYKLNMEEVKEVAYAAEDNSQKKGKSFKLQARQPKRKTKEDNNKQRKKSGYHIYCAEIRPIVKELLVKDASERTFNDKDGVGYVIELNETGEASFIDINKKCTTMWWGLSEEERSTYKSKADLIHLLVTIHKWKYETAEHHVKEMDSEQIAAEMKTVADHAPEISEGGVEDEEIEEVVQPKKKTQKEPVKKIELPPKKGTKPVDVPKKPKEITVTTKSKPVAMPSKTGKGGARVNK